MKKQSNNSKENTSSKKTIANKDVCNTKTDNKVENKRVNLVNKPIEIEKEEKDKALLWFIIGATLLLIIVMYTKYVMPNKKQENNKEITTEQLDINSEEVKNLYQYVNVKGTNDDYFYTNEQIDLLTLDNNMKLILAFNLIDNNEISKLNISYNTYQKAMEQLIGKNPYYISSENFNLCTFKNINNISYNCYNIKYNNEVNNYTLTRLENNLELCKDGYTETVLSAIKENNQIIIKSAYAYVTDVCSQKINIYNNNQKELLIGTVDNTNVENNYYNVDISLYKENLNTINYVFQIDSDGQYHFYKSYLD